MSTQPKPAEPTDEQIALAWRHMRRRVGCPATLPATLADHVWGTCLRALARQLGRPRWQATPVAIGLPQGQPVPPTPTEPPATARRQHQASGAPLGYWTKGRGIDYKRAAANDRDDPPEAA